jgi:RNA polymerase sigma factor (sigma-70 family)
MRTDDGYIISKCLDGEPEAFGLLVEKYKVGIYAFVLAKIHNYHDAQEVAQDVFIKAYTNLKNLKRWDSFAGWLYRIAINSCKNKLKILSRRPDREFAEDLTQEIPSIDSYRDDMLCESVREALDSLPETYQQVLTMYYFSEMDSTEIAKILCISPSAVRHRLIKAREQLRGEVLTMMTASFEQHRLPTSFTIRIVEAVKHIKINTFPTLKDLPWGVSFLTGIIATILLLSPVPISINLMDMPLYSPLPSETQVLKVGEIPVDVVKTSNLPFISSTMGKGKDEEPRFQNTFFMAPKDEGGIWIKKGDMPYTVCNHNLCSVNGKIYVIGGMDSFFNVDIKPFSSVYEYAPKADTWSKKADIPTPRSSQRFAVLDGKIYEIGGWTNGGFTNAVEAYDPITDKWEKKANMLTARGEAVTELANGKIYVMGGHNQHNGACLSVVEEYDPKTDTWTKKNDMPIARSMATSSVINNKIYIFGGISWLVSNFVSSVDIYDPSTDSWTKGSDIPTPRILLGTCVINGMIYVMAGDDKSFIPTPIVEIYDPVNDSWTKGQDMPIGLDANAKYPIADGKVYAIGGSTPNSVATSDVWEYTPESLLSAFSPQGKLPSTWGERKLIK